MEKLKELFAGISVRQRKLFFRAVFILVLAIAIAAAAVIAGYEQPAAHTPPLVSGQNAEPRAEQFAQSLAPAHTVNGLLRALRDWDLAAGAQWMTTTQETIFSDRYRGVLAPVSERIEFNTGVERITGNSAIVEVAIYAVDLQKALGDLSENAANYLRHRELEGAEPCWPKFVAEQLARLEDDVSSLIRIRRTAPAHLVMDENSNWFFDAQNPDNRDFYNAASGGLLDLIEKLEQVRPADE